MSSLPGLVPEGGGRGTLRGFWRPPCSGLGACLSLGRGLPAGGLAQPQALPLEQPAGPRESSPCGPGPVPDLGLEGGY